MITRMSAILFAFWRWQSKAPKEGKKSRRLGMVSLLGALIVKLEVEVGLVKLKPDKL